MILFAGMDESTMHSSQIGLASKLMFLMSEFGTKEELVLVARERLNIIIRSADDMKDSFYQQPAIKRLPADIKVS